MINIREGIRRNWDASIQSVHSFLSLTRDRTFCRSASATRIPHTDAVQLRVTVSFRHASRCAQRGFESLVGKYVCSSGSWRQPSTVYTLFLYQLVSLFTEKTWRPKRQLKKSKMAASALAARMAIRTRAHRCRILWRKESHRTRPENSEEKRHKGNQCQCARKWPTCWSTMT